MKVRVHNALEAEILIKEAYRNGTEEKYHEAKFFTHDEDFLFTCKINLCEFELDETHNGIVGDSTIVLL